MTQALIPLACSSCPWGDTFPHLWAMPNGCFRCLRCQSVKSAADISPNLSDCEVLAIDADGRLGYTLEHVAECFCADIP